MHSILLLDKFGKYGQVRHHHLEQVLQLPFLFCTLTGLYVEHDDNNIAVVRSAIIIRFLLFFIIISLAK